MTALQKGFNSIKNVLSKEQTEILETAFFAMLPVLLTKITGQFFNLIAASYFGTKDAAWENFLLASSIPDLISNVLITGSIGSIVIPTLISALRKEGKESFMRLYYNIINSSFIVFGIISLVLIIFADKIFPFFLNVLAHPETYPSQSDIDMIVQMMRVLLIPQFILSFSVFISNGLNIYNRYIIPQLAPLFFNIGRIAGVVILVPLLNYSPWAIVAGVFIGAILHLGIQIPLALKLGFNYEFIVDFKDKYLKEIFTVSIPRMFALASENIALTFNDFLAYAVKGVAALNYANSISLVIPSLFSYTFAYASFTKLSEHFEDRDNKSVESIIIKTLNEIIFLALPFIVTILVLRVPIVRLAFGILPNTRLDLDGTYQIAWVLLWFAVGHVFVCGKWFMYRVFYAAKETMIPFVVSFISLILTIFLGIIFTNVFSHNADYAITDTVINAETLLTRSTGSAAVGGIALGMSIAYSLEFFLLLFIFKKTKINLDIKALFTSIGKKLLAAAAMFTLMYLTYKTWVNVSYSLPVSAFEGYLGSTTINLLVLSTITIITSFIVYYLICLFLGVEELRLLKKYLNPIFKLGGLRIK